MDFNSRKAKFLVFPILAAFSLFIFLGRELSFFQSAKEAPVYILLIVALLAGYCFIVELVASFVVRLFKGTKRRVDQAFWVVAPAPLVLLFGLAILSTAVGKKRAFVATAEKVHSERCQTVGKLRSPASTSVDKAPIYFSNQSRQTVDVQWIDYSGNPQKYRSLAPGQKYEQQSRVGDYWIVSDSSGRCIGAYAVSKIMNQALVK